jgi:brefeldin A-resistance guanine nucleotide exchange factor 1
MCICATTHSRSAPKRTTTPHTLTHTHTPHPQTHAPHSNLYEDLVSLLSKTAFPGGSSSANMRGLGPVHHISLEALLAVLGALSETLDRPPPQLLPSPAAMQHYVEVWRPVCAGSNPPLAAILAAPGSNADAAAALAAAADAAAAATARSGGGGGGSRGGLRDSASSGSGARALRASSGGAAKRGAAAAGLPGQLAAMQLQPAVQQQPQPATAVDWQVAGELDGAAAVAATQSAVFEKGLKQRVALAVDHFNKDYKRGFQFLQVCGVDLCVKCRSFAHLSARAAVASNPPHKPHLPSPAHGCCPRR